MALSRLTPSLLALDKGLDLQTAKILAPEGTVSDTLNYEQVDFQGQKRIDGYVRYDGSAISAIDDYYVLVTNVGTGNGDILLKDGVVFGVVGAGEAFTSYYLRINYNVILSEGDVIEGAYTEEEDGPLITYNLTVVSDTPGNESGVSTEEHYTKLLEVMQNQRTNTESLPEAVAGLHWFKDRLYAVAGIVTAEVSTVDNWINREVTFTSGEKGIVVDQNSANIQILTTYDLGDDETISNTSLGNLSLGNRIDSSSATFYESRTEEQVISEDVGTFNFGWRVKHLGWSVGFDRGLALYGDLAAVNQNRQNVGIQGPTSTAGTDGSPAVLVQNIPISNAPVQVNGWKSFDSPTAYIIDAKDVQITDTEYVYADAFISWTENSSVVSTPGTNMQDLVEYPPTNTIRYTT